jgi:iron(III) transport system substrate-binding protein
MNKHLRSAFALLCVLAVAACGGTAAPAPASGASARATAPTTAAEIGPYQGADRQQLLEAGARKEGAVNWYTLMAGDSIEAIVNPFKAKYPYLKVDVFRSDAADMVTRANQEEQAGKHVWDVVDVASPYIDQLGPQSTPYFTPALASFPPELKFGASGATVKTASDWTTLIGFGYNTQLIPETAVPKTMNDLLNPALSGKLSLTGTGTGWFWVGAVLKGMGDAKGKAFLDQFAKQQKPAVQQISGKALLDLVAKGEVPASPTIFRDHVRLAVDTQKAPVAWVPLDPVATLATKIAYAAKAPHPNAGMLFLDFILGPEGQKILKDNYYTTAGGEKLPYQLWLPGEGKPADEGAKETQTWSDLFKSTFR